MAEESEKDLPVLEGDLSFLSSLAVQMHETFAELKRAGFEHEDAIQITSIVLATYMAPAYYQEFDGDSDIDFEDEDVMLDIGEEDDPDDT